jgi:surface antigen
MRMLLRRIGLGVRSVSMISSILMSVSGATIFQLFLPAAPALAADTDSYTWPTAPCEFGSSGGISCTNPTACAPHTPPNCYTYPNSTSDMYDWYENGGNGFPTGTNSDCWYNTDSVCFDPNWHFQYRNCTDYVAEKISQIFNVNLTAAWGNANNWLNYNTNTAHYTTDPTNSPKIGDIAVWTSGSFGHVAYVAGVNGSTATFDEYNRNVDGNFTNSYTTAQDGTPDGYIHIRDVTTAATGTATSSQMLNGVEHIFIGDSNGGIQDDYWGNGQQQELQVGSISAGLSIDKMSSQVSNGTIYLVFTHGNNLYTMAWGNGVNNPPTGVTSFAGNISALSTQFTSDGALHAYAGEGSNVWNVSWGNNTTFNKTLLTSEGAAVNAVSSQITPDGYQNVYVGLNNGNIMHIYWATDPTLAQQWQPGNVGASVVDITSQLVNGVTNVDAATSTAVTNFRYGNGASFAQNVIGTVSSMTIKSIGTTLTLDGYQHAIAGTSTGNIVDFAWTDPTQHTTSTPEVLPAPVAGLSVLITSGVIQVNAITTTQAYNVGWANGTNPYLSSEGTYM